jgi:hypothetical protein
LKLHDDVPDNYSYKTFSIELKKGYHSFLWQYSAWIDDDNYKDLTIEIITIDIEGTAVENYSCLTCDESIPSCNDCPENSFKNENVLIVNLGNMCQMF